jgi:hypothetical protein
MMKWSILRRRAWIVLAITDFFALSTALGGIGLLLSLKPENLYGMMFVATGAGFLWYNTPTGLKQRMELDRSPEKSP